jgi:hypothetical protein
MKSISSLDGSGGVLEGSAGLEDELEECFEVGINFYGFL